MKTQNVIRVIATIRIVYSFFGIRIPIDLYIYMYMYLYCQAAYKGYARANRVIKISRAVRVVRVD